MESEEHTPPPYLTARHPQHRPKSETRSRVRRWKKKKGSISLCFPRFDSILSLSIELEQMTKQTLMLTEEHAVAVVAAATTFPNFHYQPTTAAILSYPSCKKMRCQIDLGGGGKPSSWIEFMAAAASPTQIKSSAAALTATLCGGDYERWMVSVTVRVYWIWSKSSVDLISGV